MTLGNVVTGLMGEASKVAVDAAESEAASSDDGLGRFETLTETTGYGSPSNASSDGTAWLMEKEAALALQKDLILAFSLPAFQRQLQEHSGHGGMSFRKARMKLVRKVQLEILPRHGYAASEEGVEEMMVQFQAWSQDPDVQLNGLAINDLLNPFTPEVQHLHLSNVPEKDKRPCTKFRVRGMLQAMLKAVSTAAFQEDIRSLKAACKLGPRSVSFEDHEGWFHLPGRDDLVSFVLRKTFETYGIETMQEAMKFCAHFLEEIDIQELLDSVNTKLGMSKPACLRYRAWASTLRA